MKGVLGAGGGGGGGVQLINIYFCHQLLINDFFDCRAKLSILKGAISIVYSSKQCKEAGGEGVGGDG